MYISQDPIGLAGNNPTLYGYVKDTLSLLDIYGLDSGDGSGVNIERAAWSQDNFGPAFSRRGKFKGETVTSLSEKLQSNHISASDVPIDVIVRGKETLILNTRSSAALTLAGIPREEWNIQNRTGIGMYETMLNNQLRNSGLNEGGTYIIKQRKGGPTIQHTPKY